MSRALVRAARHAGHPRWHGERGSIAVVASLALVALIGMAALVVDGGYLAMRRRALQGVADAAALAGGFSLPTSATAIQKAKDNATANGYTNGTNGVTVTVNSPYSSDTGRIEVIVQTNVPTFLGTALHINSGALYARAVAEVDSPQALIFQGSSVCGGNCSGGTLCVQGQGDSIQGSIHSNGSLTISGNSTTTVGDLEYGNACTMHSVAGVNYGTGPIDGGIDPYPLSWTAADFPCTYKQTSGSFNVATAPYMQSATVMKPGVYCSTGGGGLQVNGSNISGNVTFIADGVIQLNGNSLNFTAYTNNVLMYTSMSTSSSTSAIQLGNLNVTYTGDTYAPNGLITSNGTNFTITGSIIGKYVQIGMTGWTMKSPTSTSTTPYLSE